MRIFRIVGAATFVVGVIIFIMFMSTLGVSPVYLAVSCCLVLIGFGMMGVPTRKKRTPRGSGRSQCRYSGKQFGDHPQLRLGPLHHTQGRLYVQAHCLACGKVWRFSEQQTYIHP
jgi:uncharacterized protein YjeT (DUF2065 family)